MKTRPWFLIVGALLSMSAAPAAAEDIVEAWRSSFGRSFSVSVDQFDGSCWAAVGSVVLHLSEDGAVLGETNAPFTPYTVLADSKTGTCWVTCMASSYFSPAPGQVSAVVEVSADGQTVWPRVSGLDYPTAVALDTSRDAIWVAFYDPTAAYLPGIVERISSGVGGGTQRWYFSSQAPSSLSLYPTDGSCWVAHPSEGVSHLFVDGSSESAGCAGVCVSVNPGDGSCWVADPDGDSVVHLAANGTELWRGTGFGWPVSVSVDPANGSCWVGAQGSLFHLSWTGTMLKHIIGLCCAWSVSADSRDGSCWVGDPGPGQIYHYSASGARLWQGGRFVYPMSVSVNPNDNSCWVADIGNSKVVHVAADGSELWTGGGLPNPFSVSVNSTDGSCWVGLRGQVVHLAANGQELWRGRGGYAQISVSVNPSDNSCWIADYYWGLVAHVAADGTLLSEGWTIQRPFSLAVNSTDGSCWVADPENGVVAHLASNGTELWRGTFDTPLSVAVNPRNGQCWVAEAGLVGQVVRLSSLGVQLSRSPLFLCPGWLAVDPTSGRCWVADWGTTTLSGCVARLEADGITEAWRRPYTWPVAVSVCSLDGTAWVSEYSSGEAIHLSAAGNELARVGGFAGPVGVSVNALDRSCWLADLDGSEVFHMTSGGSTMWRAGGFAEPVSVSVNSNDNSCWVADYDSGVVHLSASGARLWRGLSADEPESVSVNPTDGSCWVASYGSLVHLAQNGDELWRQDGLSAWAPSVSVNSSDGSCWTTLGNEVVHVAQNGTGLWSGTNFNAPESVSVNPADGSCWVANSGGGPYEVVHLAADGTELLRWSTWRFSLGDKSVSVAANPADGSCWLGAGDWHYDSYTHAAIRLAEDGSAASWMPYWTGSTPYGFGGGALYYPRSVAVNPTDGSCWVASTEHGQVVHLAVVGPVAPVAEFAAFPVSGAVPLQVAFVDQSTGSPTSWSWNFGDGSTSLEQNPSHQYVAPDFYTVSLLVANAEGWDTETKLDYITAYRFPDVLPDYWAAAYIEACFQEGVVGGYPDGFYHPDWKVDRASMAVYISRALDLALQAYEGQFPDDVPESQWAWPWIEALARAGIVQGFDPTHYDPDRVVNRDAMAVYVARSMVGGIDVPSGPAEGTFEDVPDYDPGPAHWAYDEIEYCVAHEVVAGYDPTHYRPDEPVTRDQMAVYVAKAFALPM